MRSRSVPFSTLMLAITSVAGCGHAVVPSDEVVRACETATACGMAFGIQSCVVFSASLKQMLDQQGTATFGPNEVACLARAGADCDAAQRCLNLGAPASSCAAAPDRCDGDVVRACGSGVSHAFDCASVGLRCITATDGSGRCGTSSCGADGATCGPDGATIIECNDGVLTQQSCATLDEGCVDGSGLSRTSFCAATGPSCMSTTYCDGDVVVSCNGRNEHRLDCPARGLRCVRYESGNIDCGNDNACDPASNERCDGTRVHYCYLGTPLVADCKAAGFSGCTDVGCVR